MKIAIGSKVKISGGINYQISQKDEVGTVISIGYDENMNVRYKGITVEFPKTDMIDRLISPNRTVKVSLDELNIVVD